MESYSYTTYSLDSSFQYEPQKATTKPPPAYHSALHAVRKAPAKGVITKKPIAPLPPNPPKVYKVKPVDFRDLVQRLTGAEFQPATRLQEVAPPPLSLSPPRRQAVGSPVGFSLSPASLACCSNMLMSPGTLSSLD